MIPAEFKILWNPDELDEWIEFDNQEIEKAPVNDSTKEFLKTGFPKSAAPFVDFGWRVYKDKFLNVFECYPNSRLNNLTKNYWLFGSDGSGNPICFDIANNDRIVILGHEQDFDELYIMNNNIAELADCLLAYKNFIDRIQQENGEDAFLDLDITDIQFADLKNSFKQININIFKESGFWRSEINALKK